MIEAWLPWCDGREGRNDGGGVRPAASSIAAAVTRRRRRCRWRQSLLGGDGSVAVGAVAAMTVRWRHWLGRVNRWAVVERVKRGVWLRMSTSES